MSSRRSLLAYLVVASAAFAPFAGGSLDPNFIGGGLVGDATGTAFAQTFDGDSSVAFASNSATTPNGTILTNDPILSSRTYYDGAETLGRVGHEAILRRDILHQLKKFAQMEYLKAIEKLPEEEREKHRTEYKKGIYDQFLNSEQIYSQVLDNHIRGLLFYNDYVVSRPKDQVAEQTKQLDSEFESKMVPDLMKQFDCESRKALVEYFEEEIGIDFEQEKRIFLQQTLGELWKNYNLGEENFDPSVVELRRYYEANLDEYKVEARVRWQAMTVFFGRKRTKEDARRKIAHMGNAVQAEPDTRRRDAVFAEVCRVDSEDAFAKQGGYRDWTRRGSLRSELIEQAIFSDIPLGAPSRVLEDDNSFTIVRVVEREPERIRPFSEVQEEVREKLIADRRDAMQKIYEERLSKRFSIEIYALTDQDRERRLQTAKRDDISATGRATASLESETERR